MTEYLKFDKNKGHYLDVHEMRDFYSNYSYEMEKEDNPNMEFMVAQILYISMFGALSYAVILTILAFLGEYLNWPLELFFEDFFIASCIVWAFITYVFITRLLLNKMNLKLRLETTEIGMQIYRQNLYKAKQTLKSSEFNKLIELECDTAKYEVRLDALENKNKKLH